jgi:hypothetical protein
MDDFTGVTPQDYYGAHLRTICGIAARHRVNQSPVIDFRLQPGALGPVRLLFRGPRDFITTAGCPVFAFLQRRGTFETNLSIPLIPEDWINEPLIVLEAATPPHCHASALTKQVRQPQHVLNQLPRDVWWLPSLGRS